MLKTVEKVEQLSSPDGSSVRFVGPALEWDLSKAVTIGLEFEAPWFTRREIELFLWSTMTATLEINSTALVTSPVRIKLAPSEFQHLRLAVSADQPRKGDAVRITITANEIGSADGKVFFGLGDQEVERATRIRSHLDWNSNLALYVATWVNLACLLFILMAGAGFKGYGLLTAAVVLVPNILEKLGAGWASRFSPGKFAQWIRRRMSWFAPVWRGAAFPLLALVLYMGVVFAYFGMYERRLDEHLAKATTTIGERAEFFCRYPERLESRVLLAKHLEFQSAQKSLERAYGEATEVVGPARFLSECLSKWRLLPVLLDDPASNEINARILYSSLLWNPSKAAQFAERVGQIRQILGEPNPAGQDWLRQIAFAKYELKAVKNYNEQVRCKNVDSPACAEGRAACLAARSRLEKLLDRPWLEHERASVSFLEAHDAAASSYMSTGCSYGSDSDTEAAIDHYHSLMGALQPIVARLEQPLTQINFRKFVDGVLEKRAGHLTSQSWKKECEELFPSSCTTIAETFIKDQKQTFFEPNREERAVSWGRASISSLKDEELRKKLWDERGRGWKWPL